MSAAPRVLVVLPDAMPTVGHRATVALLPHLARQRVEPVVCFLGDGPLLALCRDELRLETVLMPMVGRGAARRAIASALRSQRVVLAHSVGAGTHLLVGPAARRAGLPAVWSQYDGASVGSLVQVRAALAPANAILVASALLVARQRRLNPRQTPLTLLPPSVRRSGDSRESRRQRARASLGLGAEAFAFGWLAGAAPAGEVEVALRAASSVVHARGRARLVVFTDPATLPGPSLDSAVQLLAKRLGIDKRYAVAPTHLGPGLPPAFDALDAAFIVTADAALVALAPIEAQAAGLPLVAADAPTTRESVTHRQDGLLVPSGDHEAFAAALLSLCDDPEERQRLRTAAEKTVRERFDVHDAARRLADVYRKALER